MQYATMARNLRSGEYSQRVLNYNNQSKAIKTNVADTGVDILVRVVNEFGELVPYLFEAIEVEDVVFSDVS